MCETGAPGVCGAPLEVEEGKATGILRASMEAVAGRGSGLIEGPPSELRVLAGPPGEGHRFRPAVSMIQSWPLGPLSWG